MEWLFFVIGLLVGGAAIWLFRRQQLNTVRSQLEGTFASLSREALKDNTDLFLKLAKSTFETISKETQGKLGEQHEVIKGTITPLSEALTRYEEQLRQIEGSRKEAYGGLLQQLKALQESEAELRSQTSSLTGALRTPQVRGQWGELTLRRSVELAGLSQHCVFEEQVTTTVTNSGARPDLIVRLPAGREIIVDAKAPMIHYLDAQAEVDDTRRSELLQKHAVAVREHVRLLAGKDYQSKFAGAADFVVLFVPQESFYAAALDADKTLLEDAIQKSVFIASPTILITLLRAVALGWREEQLRESTQRISELGSKMYDRIATWLGHYAEVGRALSKAGESYNNSLGSLESRVMVSAREFKELGVTGKEELPEIKPVDTVPRSSTLFDQNDE
ncbi:MAG: DNA recombination protein RmuC [candidate division Zixibacteria bacterium]|nr:DNA recombination protein RmuC [candidate division Zixibacteria bacterium]